MQKYVLPVAKSNELGGIKVGDDFTIEKDGTLNLKENPEVLRRQADQLYVDVAAGKALVASAITDKKVPTEADATFQKMASNILAIPNGGISYTPIQININKKSFEMLEG